MGKHGFRITYLPVDANGLLNLRDVKNAIDENTLLLTIMLANNEVGTIQPVAKAAAMAKSKGILVHTDAIQAVGKMSVNVNELDVDMLSFSAHKFHGPKGIGALYLRRGVKLTPLLQGGHQEHGLRAGTENVPAIAGFGKACGLVAEQLEEWTKNVRILRDHFENNLRQIPGIQINAHHACRIPNTSNVSFEGVSGEFPVINLDLAGVAVSTGAACQTNDNEPSHVLLAMGKAAGEARNPIRFSFDMENTFDEVDMVIKLLRKIVPDLRRQVEKQ